MSMEYCYKHDHQFDTDLTFCEQCEQETAEALDTFCFLVKRIAGEMPSVELQEEFCELSEPYRAKAIKNLYVDLKEKTVAR